MKLPDEALKKRLQQGLQAAQSSSRVLQTTPINPMVLPAWQGADKSVHEAIKRVNFSEAYTNYQRMRKGQDITPELFVNPVMDLRQTLMSITAAWDQGHRWCVIQDPASESYAINIRVRANVRYEGGALEV